MNITKKNKIQLLQKLLYHLIDKYDNNSEDFKNGYMSLAYNVVNFPVGKTGFTIWNKKLAFGLRLRESDSLDWQEGYSKGLRAARAYNPEYLDIRSFIYSEDL